MTTASFYLTINKKITGEDNLNASNDISAINKIVEEVLAKGKELDSNIKVLVEQANKKITTIDTALNQKLNEMQADYNSLQKIIIDENQAANLQNQVNKTNAQLDNKANYNTVWSMVNMGQDVKEAMTGGSVAVVGKNTVLTENIVDRQVTRCKTSFYSISKNGNLIDRDAIITLSKVPSAVFSTVNKSMLLSVK